MELITVEYEVRSRKDELALIGRLAENDYKLSFALDGLNWVQRPRYYVVWEDHSVTVGDKPMTIVELKAPGFERLIYNAGDTVKRFAA
jgi:hypothetical protein